MYVKVYSDKLYLVAETVDVSEEDGGGIVVIEAVKVLKRSSSLPIPRRKTHNPR